LKKKGGRLKTKLSEKGNSSIFLPQSNQEEKKRKVRDRSRSHRGEKGKKFEGSLGRREERRGFTTFNYLPRKVLSFRRR